MKTSGGLQPPGRPSLQVPEVTLYGDGTLIYAAMDAGGRLAIFQADVSDDAIGGLLEEIEDAGFFNFPYELASPVIATEDLATTYVYVNSKVAANAVNAYALGADDVNEQSDGDEFEYYRRLVKIAERIDALTPADGAQPYRPDAIALVVVLQEGSSGEAEPWSVDAIDLAEIANGEDVAGERLLSGEQAAAIIRELPALTFRSFQEDGNVFAVGYRPVLPFEEHFPEFETPP